MFKPRILYKTPLKEGRLPLAIPGGAMALRRNHKAKQVALAITVLVFLYTIFWDPYLFSLNRPSASTAASSPGRADPASAAATLPGQTQSPAPPLDHVKGEGAVAGSPPHQHAHPHGGDGQDAGTGTGTGSTSPSSSFAYRPGFEAALLKIINLLPSELETRGLLRPVEFTGEQRLRELGLLARKYKKYYEAWEDLHVAHDGEGGTHVRDDVIQYLRHQASLNTATAATAADADADDTTTTTSGSGDLAERIHAYEEFRRLLTRLNDMLFPFTAPYFADHMTFRSHLRKGGRGIVLTAGNDQVAYLLTQIPMLRAVGCDLPIEVMYVGDGDLNRDSRQDLEDLAGVVTRDIAAMITPAGWDVASWAAKPFAMLLSSFREVIFIDADSFFFVDPAVMFDDPGYARTGALFFRDRLIMPESKKSWLQSVLPQPVSRNVKNSRLWAGTSGHQQESGVLVVDKYRHFLAMLFVARMNGPDRDGNREAGKIGVYDMVYGDKETFWLGWELVGDTDYVFHDGDAGIIGLLEPPVPSPFDAAMKRAEEEEEEEEEAEDEDQDENGGEDDDDLAGGRRNATLTAPGELPKHRVCSPQLLHLDLDGKPFWFNGGLVRNKFVDRREWKFGAWDTYLIEPRDIREPGAWFLGDANMCCLTTDNHLKGDLSPREMELMDMMVKQARKVGIAA